MTWRVELGDSRERLRELADASIDAVVTDPPYELGFMGKKWDASGIAYDVGLWGEVLRVLKPGGHLLAFGATRTYHRMAVAIEDAGFEIRDSIHWVYGSGFPKSLDVSKAIDKRRYDRADVLRVTAWIRERRDAAGVTNAEIDAAFGFRGMAGHWTSSLTQPAVPTLDQVPALLAVLGVSKEEIPAEIRRLLFELNGWKGEPGAAFKARPIVGQRQTGIGTGKGSVKFIGDGSRDVTAPATDVAQTWSGWGTALKPSHEPIVVARKPLDGTVAANVLAHGTGAINVDGCRVGTDGGGTVCNNRDAVGNCLGHSNGDRSTENPTVHAAASESATGRWPPNTIFSHLIECGDTCAEGCAVAELDAQSGTLTSGAPGGAMRRQRGTFSANATDTPLTGYGDSGGASRFFPAFRYQAKPARSEREAGLEDMPKLKSAIGDIRPSGEFGERLGRPATMPRANSHPTVKPVELMRWLVRLVTPAGGTVLDPFTGSGTTGCAAILERCSFVGVELSDEYRAIACARIEAAEAGRPCEQLDLFGGW